MTDLAKTRVVLPLASDEGSNGPAHFQATPDEEPSPCCCDVHPDVWEDMGRPQQITVTIEPGDLLNEPCATCDVNDFEVWARSSVGSRQIRLAETEQRQRDERRGLRSPTDISRRMSYYDEETLIVAAYGETTP